MKKTTKNLGVITAIAKETATIWLADKTKLDKFDQCAVPADTRLEFNSIEVGQDKLGTIFVRGRAWNKPQLIRYLSGSVRSLPSRLKYVWVRPREWCWCVGHIPDVTVQWSLVDFGYQLDIFNEAKQVACTCRDFGGNHKIDDMQEWLIMDAEAAADRLRKKFP